ncbi:MAG: hypothetical protein KQH63_09405 [Desulfobulbaceae bacterium]|nr:hypothetical protein [Desulfobulbaceae bacterium]
MPEFMPLSLVITYIAFFGFLNTHQRHSARFEGASQTYHLALNISLILGVLVGLSLMIYYGYLTVWYWPIVLFLLGSLIGGLLFGLLDVTIGLLIMSLLSFAGWPISAYVMYRIVSNLGG